MAPSRKKGGGKAAAAASARHQWKVGDLVLAKVKGFPAWPALVDKPEKWGYTADWKKVLVYFFGTGQIALCKPTDVESFTEEKKQSLLTKRHAKGSDFIRAVKEITESYEKLKQQQAEAANDPKPTEETDTGSSGNAKELPQQACENVNGSTQIIESNSSHRRDGSPLLSEDASAAEQMLALRHNSLPRNGACDSSAAKDLCEIATSKRRNERARSLKKEIVPIRNSKISSRVELDRLQSSTLQCSGDVGHSVDDIDDGSIRRRKRIRRSGQSESEYNLHGSDEEISSEIATVESDNNSRNEGNGVDSGELNNGLSFQISTMVKRKKRKPTRKRENGCLIDPLAKVEQREEVMGTKVSGSCQGSQNSLAKVEEAEESQNSLETLNERPSEGKGDEHLPLVKRARVRMSRAFSADEKANTSSQIEERASKDTVTSGAMQTSPSVNHENDLALGHDASLAEECNSFELSAKLPCEMVDVVPMEKPSERMSPSGDLVKTVEDTQTPMEVCEIKHSITPGGEVAQSQSNQLSITPDGEVARSQSSQLSITPDGEVARSQSSQLSTLPERNIHVSEVVEGCSEESQNRNCVNTESSRIDMQCSLQTEVKRTSLNPDIVGSPANKSPNLCSGLDMTSPPVPAQSPRRQQSQDKDSCDNSLITDEKCVKIDNMSPVVKSQATEHSPLFSSAAKNQEAEIMEETENALRKNQEAESIEEIQNALLKNQEAKSIEETENALLKNQEAESIEETENALLKKSQGSPDKELDSDNKANVEQLPALSASEKAEPQTELDCDMIVEEAEPQNEKVPSHLEDAMVNKELEKSHETDGQKEQIQTTNYVMVSENRPCDQESSSPDSPARNTQHSNSDCHISSVESANVIPNSRNCPTDAKSSENNSMGDNSVKEEKKVESGVTQPKKVGSPDVQSTIKSFETALGSLVRTKETIGRATRLAMDLAKFGASAKAMEIVAHSLESESNLQRRVVLFFLVDSIAQCSKGLNGDAGGVYLSSIQVMLPRLLAAAVPAGAPTQENRIECLKVLKLWLERRILPESIVRRHIRELDAHTVVPACLYSRRSARTERALDDPVRDMEGMLVDEYGSNSTLQLHGFCMPSMLKDDDDEGSDSDEGDFESVTPEHESRNNLEEHVAPSVTERHTRILEDVDGELEMEDVAPPWEVGNSAIPEQAVPSNSHQNMTSLSPPAHPSQNAQSDPYSNGYDCNGYPNNMHGEHPRMNPLPMHYRSPESSYNSRGSMSKNMPRGEGSNFQHRPYPPPHYSYMEQRREGGPSYPHRSHYGPEYDERNYNDNHDRMRHGDNWRYHPPSSHGPRYNDRHKGPYQSSSSYNGGHHRDNGRFQNNNNNRWSDSPRNGGYNNNNRNSFHYKQQQQQQHPEGPVPVGMRDPGTWHQR